MENGQKGRSLSHTVATVSIVARVRARAHARVILLTQCKLSQQCAAVAAHSVWPAARGAAGLVEDLAVWQCLLEFGNARVGDPGAPEGELLQVGQSLKMQQARDRAGRKRPVWSP